MPSESERPRVTQRGGPKFRPIAVLGLLYFAVFFCVFGLLLVVPEMSDVLQSTTAANPEEQKAAAQAAVHAVFRPRMPIAIVLALLATAAGARFKLLPGFRF